MRRRPRGPLAIVLAPALLTLLLTPLLAAAVGGAVEPPTVEIDFEVAEPDYRDELGEPALSDLRTEAAALLAKHLGGEIAFVGFEPAAQLAAQSLADCPDSDEVYRICIRLDSLERGRQAVAHEVGLHFQLTGPDVAERDAQAYWTFRASEDWGDPVPQPEELLRELRLLFDGADTPGLVRDVLSQVKLGEQCRVLREEPKGWLLPFTRADLCMDRGSQLRIKHELVVATITEELLFTVEASGEVNEPGSPEHGRVYCKAIAGFDPARLEELHRAPEEALAKTEVYVLDYQRLDTECSREPESPTDVEFEAGETDVEEEPP